MREVLIELKASSVEKEENLKNLPKRNSKFLIKRETFLSFKLNCLVMEVRHLYKDTTSDTQNSFSSEYIKTLYICHGLN